jgi:hypothetical protein
MFQPLYLGTNHMFGQDAYVPVMTQNFEIRIYNMDGTTPGDYADTLTLTTDSIGDISESQNTIEVHYGNGVIKFPGKVTFDDVDWTLNCFTSPNTLEALRAWKRQIYDTTTEAMGKPTQYMKQAYIIKYSGDGQQMLDVIKLPGVWIKDLKNGAMAQKGDEMVQVSVTLVVSKAIYLKPEDFGNIS